MPALHVCPLSRLAETVAAVRPSHLLTVINAATPVPRPEGIGPENHLVIGVSDILEAMDGHILPGEEHARQIIGFVRRWNRERPMVVHCYAGISRSTAAAYIGLCALRPDLDEFLLAERLRRAAPSATPNARLVASADRLLGRRGRMSEAIAAIGRGVDAFEGTPFALPLDS